MGDSIVVRHHRRYRRWFDMRCLSRHPFPPSVVPSFGHSSTVSLRHPLTLSCGHSWTVSFGHPLPVSFGHPLTASLGHSLTVQSGRLWRFHLDIHSTGSGGELFCGEPGALPRLPGRDQVEGEACQRSGEGHSQPFMFRPFFWVVKATLSLRRILPRPSPGEPDRMIISGFTQLKRSYVLGGRVE